MNDQTQVMSPPTLMGGNQTQMGGSVSCPGCGTNNPSMEIYCNECGLKLDTVIDTTQSVQSDEAPGVLIDATGVRRNLKLGVNTVGRIDADVLLPDETVSRLHARITIENNTFVLEDAGSTNGSRVNDVRLSAGDVMQLQDGNAVRFGNWKGKIEIAIPKVVTPPLDDITPVGVAPDLDETILQEEELALAPPIADLHPEKSDLDTIELGATTTSLGRRDSNSVILKHDAYISGLHAEITSSDDGLFLTDLGSTNGTFVNKTKLSPNSPQLLNDGDIVQLGQTDYTFKLRSSESISDEEELS